VVDIYENSEGGQPPTKIQILVGIYLHTRGETMTGVGRDKKKARDGGGR
jgi:hypothetical protein